MPNGEVASGQLHGWKLIQKLGEGDAGEVFIVESLIEKKQAILKRPRHSPFTSDILRQSNQIRMEGQVLASLRKLIVPYKDFSICAPGLIDTSQPGSEYNERFFIVIEKAPGIDLARLAQAVHQGQPAAPVGTSTTSSIDQHLHQSLNPQDELPDLLVLKILAGTLAFLGQIHRSKTNQPGQAALGVIWNDVKPSHLFWDIQAKTVTVIDWGNAQFVGSDGASEDRRFTLNNDYIQFVQEMGTFLKDLKPLLYQELDWPSEYPTSGFYNQVVKPLQNRLEKHLDEELADLRSLRKEEEDLILARDPQVADWLALDTVQAQILKLAELPDWFGAERLAIKLASRMINEGSRQPFLELCQQIARLPGIDHEPWEIILVIARLYPWPGLFQIPIQQALLSAIEKDWPGALWQLRLAAGQSQLPGWWQNLSERIRRLQPEVGQDALTPLVVLNRLILTLQVSRQRDPEPQMPVLTGPNFGFHLIEPENEPEQSPEQLLARYLKETVARRWVELEPDPPDSGLEYSELEEQMEIIGFLEPNSKENLVKVLEQPGALVKVTLGAWNLREFETARRGLRRLFLWDPDRQRLFLADQAIARAPAWLNGIRQGPESDESLHEFITRFELRGREMRNQVGTASWLDQILEAFARLRRGASPSDILLDYAELRSELPWLVHYHPPLLKPLTGPVLLERRSGPPLPEWLLYSERVGTLGLEGELELGEPQDTWAPEARGSSARVLTGILRGEDRLQHPAAIKVMRPGMLDYAIPLFHAEAQILTLMGDIPGVNPPLEFGFLHLQEDAALPDDTSHQVASSLSGMVRRIPTQDIRGYLSALDTLPQQGWLPYIALALQPREDNLMMLCDSGYTHGRFLSLKEGIRFSIQILDILQIAHSRNIAYRDYKILHFYWKEAENGIVMIDWNVARHAPQGLSTSEKCADLVQFGARALHHILTGRPAPGALPVGPTRPEEIEQAAATYAPQWNFDDQRLPTRLREIIERVLAGSYNQAAPLRNELETLFRDLPDES
jgi:serine/threonine protein kinase